MWVCLKRYIFHAHSSNFHKDTHYPSCSLKKRCMCGKYQKLCHADCGGHHEVTHTWTEIPVFDLLNHQCVQFFLPTCFNIPHQTYGSTRGAINSPTIIKPHTSRPCCAMLWWLRSVCCLPEILTTSTLQVLASHRVLEPVNASCLSYERPNSPWVANTFSSRQHSKIATSEWYWRRIHNFCLRVPSSLKGTLHKIQIYSCTWWTFKEQFEFDVSTLCSLMRFKLGILQMTRVNHVFQVTCEHLGLPEFGQCRNADIKTAKVCLTSHFQQSIGTVTVPWWTTLVFPIIGQSSFEGSLWQQFRKHVT